MGKNYVLAIDQSTQGTKAILFDGQGKLVCRRDRAHRQLVNERGWVSHDLEEIYDNTLLVVQDVVEAAGIAREDIAVLGISNQRETSAAWERGTGKPLANAVVWQCARAEELCRRVADGAKGTNGGSESVEEMVRSRTGIRLSPYFPAAKFAWLLENEGAVQEAARTGNLCLGTIDAYLVYRLTGGKVFATDYSNASRTQLFNIHTLAWDGDICLLFGIRSSFLPTVTDSDGDFGSTDFDGYLPRPIPIRAVLGDSHGALYGQHCHEPGMVKATYGTGSSIMMNTGGRCAESSHGLVTSLAWKVNGQVQYVVEGNINYTGAVMTWLQRDMELIQSPAEAEELARNANPEDETILVPAFTGLSAPHWKTDAKALVYGMGRMTGRAEFAKAALESIAYQISDVLDAMAEDAGQNIRQLRVDGGPTKNSYLMEFQAGISDTELLVSSHEELSALGAGYLAGIAAGVYDSGKVFEQVSYRQYRGSMSEEIRRKKKRAWTEAVDKL